MSTCPSSTTVESQLKFQSTLCPFSLKTSVAKVQSPRSILYSTRSASAPSTLPENSTNPDNFVPNEGPVKLIPIATRGISSAASPSHSVAPNAKSRAHAASTRPNPHLLFHRSETDGSEASGSPDWRLDSDELRNMSLISWGVKSSSAWSIAATIPETTGVAMLVPLFDSYSLSARGCSGCPGKLVPNAAVAEMMLLPKAVMSGFSSSQSSSSPSSKRGP